MVNLIHMNIQSDSDMKITAEAHPNIAFIKYWGNRDDTLRLPSNGSISMNLAELVTRTTVEFDSTLKEDCLLLNGRPAEVLQAQRVSAFLDLVRQKASLSQFARVVTENNFPAGSGIASSASAFAALAVAASKAAGLSLSEREISTLARRGSGSASRSIPAGFVEWFAGTEDVSSFAQSFAQPDHWDLVDLVAVLDSSHKKTGSTAGHRLAVTSPLQAGRVADTPRRLDICRKAVLERDFSALATIIEQDCLMMHGVMMTSNPVLFYWLPATLQLTEMVPDWRMNGLPVAFTIDAGPNVHLIAPAESVSTLRSELHRLPAVQDLFITHPGGGAHLVE
jgi:diphosphomevalonate decarboxylase